MWLCGDLGGADRHRHESRHSDQWAMFGLAFPALYGAESVRTDGDFHRNVFERWAGLHDGGYLPDRARPGTQRAGSASPALSVWGAVRGQWMSE